MTRGVRELPLDGYSKVGTVYGTLEHNGRTIVLRHYACHLLPNRPDLDGDKDGCCHWSCRMQALRDAGKADVADKLEQNARAKDWLGNWGKMIYDPERHGRDPERRRRAATMIRLLRSRAIGYADACRLGVWSGASTGKEGSAAAG